ncbi:alcohol dehydrogenase [Ranunculus cassubicifolius]
MGSMGNDSNGGNGRFVPSEETRGKVITCKAAVVWGPKEPLVMEEIQIDPPQNLEVRIKIIYTSVCHSDLSAWQA